MRSQAALLGIFLFFSTIGAHADTARECERFLDSLEGRTAKVVKAWKCDALTMVRVGRPALPNVCIAEMSDGSAVVSDAANKMAFDWTNRRPDGTYSRLQQKSSFLSGTYEWVTFSPTKRLVELQRARYVVPFSTTHTVLQYAAACEPL